MTNRLLLYIDERWPARPSAPWALLDAAGRLLSEGACEPAHWPAAESCEIVLGGPQSLRLEVRLPKAARRDQPRLLAYALEDRLLKDPDSQHLTMCGSRPAEDGGEHVGVLVVARERLRTVLAQLAAIGRAPARAWSELLTAPASDGAWSLSLTADFALLRTGQGNSACIDNALLQPMLAHELARARSANTLPDSLELHVAPGLAVPGADSLGGLGEVRTSAGDAYSWWAGAARSFSLADLLHDEFAARHRDAAWKKRLKPAIWLATAACSAWLAAGLGHVAWLRHQLADADTRMLRIHQTSLPNAPAIAPAAQLQRALDDARARAGRLRSDDMLTLLADVSEVLGPDSRNSMRAVHYDGGRLELLLVGGAARRAESAGALLLARGLQADARQEGDALRLVVRRGEIR